MAPVSRGFSGCPVRVAPARIVDSAVGSASAVSSTLAAVLQTPFNLAVAEMIVAILSGRRRGPAALATVIGRNGSAPQGAGARLLWTADGQLYGTVGGGAIEAQVLEACRACLRDGVTRTVKANLVRDLGMCCGGSMEVFVELLQAQSRLVLIGAGHVAQAIAPIAEAAGFRVAVLDDREDMLAHPAFAGAQRLDYDVDELAQALPEVGAHDFVVILTRDHQRDEQALSAMLGKPYAYLGMIGSRRKVHAVLARILNRCHGQGLPRPCFDRVHAPIGLALGGRTPSEIAVSVVAELIAVRCGGSTESMNILPQVVDQVAVRIEGAGRE